MRRIFIRRRRSAVGRLLAGVLALAGSWLLIGLLHAHHNRSGLSRVEAVRTANYPFRDVAAQGRGSRGSGDRSAFVFATE